MRQLCKVKWLSKDCPLEHLKYRKKVEIPELGFVDDLCDVNKCGKETREKNEYTSEQINKRRLQFSKDKCVRMHIQSKAEQRKSKCEAINIDGWKVETYKEDNEIKQRDVHTG